MKFSRIIFAAIAGLVICSSNMVSAQNLSVPDRNKISAVSRDTYKTLLEKFVDGRTLTGDDMAVVYYGAALQPGFNADRRYTALLSAYDAGDMAKVYTLVTEALKSDPTNLMLLFKAYASASVSTDSAIKALAPKYQTRLLQVCDLILNSGLGVSESSPYLVIRPSDRDEFVAKYLQPVAVEGQARIGSLDAVKLKLENIPDDVILYFSTFK